MTGRSDTLPLPFLDVCQIPRYSFAARETDACGKLALIHQQINGRRAKAGKMADLPATDEPGWHVAGEIALGGISENIFRCHGESLLKTKGFPVEADVGAA